MHNKEPKIVTLSQNHMATTFDLSISVDSSRCSRAEACLLECHSLIETLESELSEFRENSSIYRFNHSENGDISNLQKNAFELFNISESIKEKTDGAFSPQRKPHSKHISFGAIGKGYALDKLREKINSWGFEDFLLNAGGSSIFLSGLASKQQPWTFEWDGARFSHHSGQPIAIGISGTAEQGLHIINPISQEKVGHLYSTFVSHPSCTYADAISTAVYVLGFNKSLKVLDRTNLRTAIAVHSLEEGFIWNGLFQNAWGPIH